MRRKWISSLLILSMVFVLTACKTESGGQEKPSGQTGGPGNGETV